MFDTAGDPSTLAVQCGRWKRAFELNLVAWGQTPEEHKRALLLNCAGMAVQDIIENLPNKGINYHHTIRALDAYFGPKLKNHTYKRHLFCQLQQKEGETTDQFITCLRQHAVNCNFDDQKHNNIQNQVIKKCVDRHLNLKGKYLEKGL